MTSFEHWRPFVYTMCIKMSVEQRTAIKFCVLNGKNRKETMEMLVKAYGDAAMKRQHCISGTRGKKTDTKV